MLFPKAKYDGISDGAPDLVAWLTKQTEQLTFDLFHAAGHLSTAAAVMVEPGKMGNDCIMDIVD